MEVWKDVKNYEGFYKVSNLGNVMSVERYVKRSRGGVQILRGRILKPRMTAKYGSVNLSKEGKQKSFYIHSLVIENFKLEPKPKGFVVDHINRNPIDNRIENLRYCSQRENLNNRSPVSKTGYVGVSENPENYNKKYRARIRIKGKMKELGSFNNAIEAGREYLTKKNKIENGN